MSEIIKKEILILLLIKLVDILNLKYILRFNDIENTLPVIFLSFIILICWLVILLKNKNKFITIILSIQIISLCIYLFLNGFDYTGKEMIFRSINLYRYICVFSLVVILKFISKINLRS